MYEWHTDHTNFNSSLAISVYESGMQDINATYYYGSNEGSTELLVTSMGNPKNKINKKFKSRTSHNSGEIGGMVILCQS
jgi:hypothetical protein